MVGASSTSAASFGNGLSLMPWKLRDQSTFSLLLVWVFEGRSRGASERPVWARLEVVGWRGVGCLMASARFVVAEEAGLDAVDVVDVVVLLDAGFVPVEEVVVCERDASIPG